MNFEPDRIGTFGWSGFKKEPVTNYYNITGKIRSGTFAHVYRGINKQDGITYAIKQIPKTNSQESLEVEVKILSESDHPNIINLWDKLEDARNWYIVMQECTGGDLFDHIQSEGPFSDSMARSIFEQIAKAVKYLHSRNICHRDVKLENVLLETRNP